MVPANEYTRVFHCKQQKEVKLLIMRINLSRVARFIHTLVQNNFSTSSNINLTGQNVCIRLSVPEI